MSKVIFITGASKGFGKLWAEALLKRGDKVAASARNISVLNDLKAEYGDQILPLTTVQKFLKWLRRLKIISEELMF